MSIANIQDFRIGGLFGEHNLTVPIKDNRIILVGENGIGKTTISNIFYATLTRQWQKLLTLPFDDISLKIGGRRVELAKESIELATRQRKSRRRGPSSVFMRLEDIVTNHFEPDEIEELSDASLSQIDHRIRKISPNYRFNPRLVRDFLQDWTSSQSDLFAGARSEFFNADEILRDKIKAQIYYLPTYRRIERELEQLVPNLEEYVEDFRSSYKEGGKHREYIELVEFGMEDVDELLQKKRSETLQSATIEFEKLAGEFLHDVINGNADDFDRKKITSLSDSYIESVLSRIDDKTLAERDKERVREFVTKIKTSPESMEGADDRIGYLLSKILDAAKKVEEKEKTFSTLLSICNQYLTDKSFRYDRSAYKLYISKENGREIGLRNLSSGEKQIISLFTHLLIGEKDEFGIIIDEPELSLSVPWQIRFLEDLSSLPGCKLLAAVTHSPFVFRNSLESYTQDLAQAFNKQ